MTVRGFAAPELDESSLDELAEKARIARGAVLTMTSLAQSGHPGGSFSSMETFMLLYHFGMLRPEEPDWPGRDRIVVSHGHTSPGVYAALASAGFFPLDEAVAHFRQVGHPFEGHVERTVPGVEWNTGNLGQGLSAGLGFALAAKVLGEDWHVYVAMSDAEQHKGQVSEARRVAVAHGVSGITVVVDLNDAQISGHATDVMPVEIAEDYRADGWEVLAADGHDLAGMYAALHRARSFEKPCVVLARNVIGRGVSFMEDEPDFHGRALKPDEYERAMEELGIEPDLERYRELRARPSRMPRRELEYPSYDIVPGPARTYGAGERTDDRSAWGQALADLALVNRSAPMAVLDCDLMTSVKTEKFAQARPGAFFQFGVGEHNAAAAAGALSTQGVLTFWADFGVFGLDETYNQARLNDINRAAPKVVLTHCGLDVGEDGKTHHCIDYVSAFRNMFGWKVLVPADPNQTDRAVRAAATMPGPVCVAMGRSKLAVITNSEGAPFFGEAYEFRYGSLDWVRRGEDAVIVTMGTVSGGCVAASDRLATKGVSVGVAVVASPLGLTSGGLAPALSVPLLVTVEDHNVHTGLGAIVAGLVADSDARPRLLRLGVARYHGSGEAASLLAESGLDTDEVERALIKALSELPGER